MTMCLVTRLAVDLCTCISMVLKIASSSSSIFSTLRIDIVSLCNGISR